MIFTLGALRGTIASLENVLGQKLPIQAAYRFARFLTKSQAELAELEKGRVRLCEQYSRKDKAGSPLRFRSEPDDKGGLVAVEEGYRGDFRYDITDQEAFNREYIELANTEVEVDFKPLELAQLGDIEVSPIDMMALQVFLVADA